MRQFDDWNKWISSRELSNEDAIQPSCKLLSWRKQSTVSTAQHNFKNQNAIGHHSNQKLNPQLSDASSTPISFTADNKREKINSHISQKSVTITRRSSKPSRDDSIQIITSETRKRQRDRYITYCHRLEENQLYSLIVSSNGVECYESNCQPSVFNASYRCQPISFEKLPLMNEQDIKHNISYISLINLSNIIDHEPNISRRDSYSQSSSNLLMHKPSLFLTEIFHKMTHEQRTKSILALTKLHENLTKSHIVDNKLQRTISMPNLNRIPTTLHSVTSLLSERTTANLSEIDNKTLSKSPVKHKYMDENVISKHINPKISNVKHTTNLNGKITSISVNQKVHLPVHISQSSDKHVISSPVKLMPFQEHKLAHESIIEPSSIVDESDKSNRATNLEKNRSINFLDTDHNELQSPSKFKCIKTLETEEMSSQFLNLSNPIKDRLISSTSTSITNFVPDKKQQFESKTKSKITVEETDLDNPNDLFSKSNIKQNLQELYSEKYPNQPLNISSSSSYFEPSNNENETENSLNDVTEHLSQQETILPSINLDQSFDFSSKDSNRIQRTLPLLEKIDEVSQQSKSSHSHLKNSILMNSPASISSGKEILSVISTKLGLKPLSSMSDVDTSMISRTTTASTNLTAADDNDEQSKLINEQLKQSSLRLARDSLELLRNNTPHHDSNDEQLISHTNIDNTPRKRKSVLKSHFASSDNLPTPEPISYIAIDDVNSDKRLVEKQIRRRSLTIGGGTVVLCKSPKPKRDSLILLQERYSGSITPHSGCHHLSNSDSKHVEFIRGPGNTITPALHIGRGTKSKHSSSKQISPTFSTDHYHHFSGHTFDSTERSKSEISVINDRQRFDISPHSRRPSLDSTSRYRTPQIQFTSKVTSATNADDIEVEKVCLNKSDYDKMVRLIMTPLSKKKKKHPVTSPLESNIQLCINNRLTIIQNVILFIGLISFYVFIFVKSQYWHEYNQK